MFLGSINIFRGISIILVVSGHTLSISGLHPATTVEKMIISLISGATTTFIFMSGFLFHHVFYRKFEYKKFVVSKFKNIVVPYTIISFPIILITLYMGKYYLSYFMPQGQSVFEEWVVPFFKYYITGRALTAYWYVPFITIIFLLSPFHMLFIKLQLWKQVAIVTGFYCLAVIIHRPIGNTNQIHNVIYGTGPYLLGILCSINRQNITKYAGKWKFGFLAMAILFAYYQSSTGRYGNFHKDMLSMDGIDLMLLQKTCLCLFALIYLQKFENKSYALINILSSYSFGIFFVHAPIIRITEQFLSKDLPKGWIAYILYTVILIVISCGIVWVSRWIFKDKSRYLVGY